MERYPQNLELEGSCLHLVAQGRYDISFHFDAGVHIAVWSEARVHPPDGAPAVWTEASGWNNLSFEQVLNLTVRAVQETADSSLCIIFEDDTELRCVFGADGHESFQITFDDPERSPIVV